MEKFFFGAKASLTMERELRRNFLESSFSLKDECIFFEYLLKPEAASRLNFQRYGDRTGCEASVNGFHVVDFCEDRENVLAIAYGFLQEFIKLWRSKFNGECVVYFGLIPEEEEFGPDVTFTFHKKRAGESWMDLEKLEDATDCIMVVEI